MINIANLSGNKFTGKVNKKERKAQKAKKRPINDPKGEFIPEMWSRGASQKQIQPISEKTLALQKQIKLLREGAKPHFIPSLEAAQASFNKLLED
jgi:hypothetical protein